MKYSGPLYAKIAGEYVPVEHDSQYYDRLEAENARLKCCGNCLSDRYNQFVLPEECYQCSRLENYTDLTGEKVDRWESQI